MAQATRLVLRLSLGFGKATQKDQDVVLCLPGRGDQVTVGEGARR